MKKIRHESNNRDREKRARKTKNHLRSDATSNRSFFKYRIQFRHKKNRIQNCGRNTVPPSSGATLAARLMAGVLFSSKQKETFCQIFCQDNIMGRGGHKGGARGQPLTPPPQSLELCWLCTFFLEFCSFFFEFCCFFLEF